MTEPKTIEELLMPAEKIALTMALARALRGEEPLPNTATMCVLALARLAGKHDWTKEPPIQRIEA